MKVVNTICALLCMVALLGAAKAPPLARSLTGANQAPSSGNWVVNRPGATAGAYPGIPKATPPRPTDDSLWINVGTLTGLSYGNGLKVYGNQIWTASGNDQAIHILDRTSGALIRSFSFPTTAYAMGLTRYGVNSESVAIACFYPSNGFYFADTLGNWNPTFLAAPSGYASRGLDYDGSKFWVADVNAPRIYTMNRAGTVLRTLSASGGLYTPYWFMDITLDRTAPNHMWAIDNSPIQVYYMSFDTSANTYTVTGLFNHPDAANTPEGLGYWADGIGNGFCYTSTYYAATIFKMQVHRVVLADDVGVNSIIAPATMVAPGSSVTPSVVITNYGSNSESNIPVTMWIDSGATRVYTSNSYSYSGTLAPGASVTVTLTPNWTIGSMNNVYNATSFTNLGSDLFRGNDTMYRTVVSMPPPNRCFDPEWTLPKPSPDGTVSIYAAAAVQDTLLFVAHGYYENKIVIYRISDLAPVDSFVTPQVSSYGYIDFHYDAGENVLYAGSYGVTNAFDRWDATTHAYIGRVNVTGSATPGANCFAITGDGDSLYLSGFGVGIYKCAKNGTNCHQVLASVPQASVIGLGLDKSRGIMYVTNSYSPPDHLLEYNIATWSLLLDTILNPTLSDWGGCETFHGDTFLLGVIQDLDDIVQCRRLIPLALDVGVDLVESPTGLIAQGTFPPKVRIKNYGANASPSFPATLTITGGYTPSTVTVPALNPGDTAQITFADWTPTGTGAFTLRCSTEMPGDQRARNDVGIGLALIATFVENFEASNGAFTPGGGWTWGVPASPRPAAHSGTNVWGAPLTGTYPTNMNWALNSCVLGALQDNPIVAFYQWYYLETGWDGGNCKYSTNGGTTWNIATPLASLGATYNGTASTANAAIPGEPCFTGGPAGWELAAFQIPVTTGTQFLVRWHAGSDGSVEYNGWIIDDVAGIGCRPPLMDVGVAAITRPNAGETPGASIPVQIRVHNYGEVSATFDIRATIANTMGSDTLRTQKLAVTLASGGEQVYLMDDLWSIPTTPSVFEMRCSTVYAFDQVPGNNKMQRTIYTGTLDAAVDAIIAPTGTYDTFGLSLIPSAKIKNLGAMAAPFHVFLWFDSTGATVPSYSESTWVTIPPLDSSVIILPPWSPWIPQNYAVKCSVYVPSDANRLNDVKTGAFTVIPGSLDYAIDHIIVPFGVYDTLSPIVPSVQVRNDGTSDRAGWLYLTIDDRTADALVYNESVAVSVPGGGSLAAVLPEWPLPHLPLWFSTETHVTVLGDQNLLNNAHADSFLVALGTIDYAVEGIVGPTGSHYDTMETITPSATIKNYGTINPLVKVIFTITDSTPAPVYCDTLDINDLLPDEMRTVTFDEWLPKPHPYGSYTTLCLAVSPGDADPLNDSKTGAFSIRFQLPNATWSAMSPLPLGIKNKNIKDGGALAYAKDATDANDTAYVYAFKGNNRYEFYRYNTVDNTWLSRESIPAIGRSSKKKAIKKGSSLVMAGDAKLYASKGNNTLDWWSYDPVGRAWTQKADVPLGAKNVKEGAGSVAVNDGGVDYVYLLRGSGTWDFFRYDPATDVWDTSLPAAPGGASGKPYKNGSSLSYDGGDTIYALKGSYNEFFAYSVSGKTWTTKEPLPLVGGSGTKKKKVKDGSGTAYAGQTVYALKGGNTNEFWTYKCDSHRWIIGAELTAGTKRVKGGGALVAVKDINALFAFRGNNTPEFWKFGPIAFSICAAPKAFNGVMSAGVQTVSRYSLLVAPNPFTRVANVSYAVPKSGNLSLKLYDVTGKLVTTLANGYTVAGNHNALINAEKLARGIYLLKFDSDDYKTTSKLIIE